MRTLFGKAGIRTSSGRLPRTHDFRHGFALAALLRWYSAGVDVQTKLPSLATYMGHVSIVSTAYTICGSLNPWRLLLAHDLRSTAARSSRQSPPVEVRDEFFQTECSRSNAPQLLR